ncbi:hypothetical protein SIN8267_02138 [Sinobacterium norvegicum]|uniref:Uncharacterized protein n=1 Tax=Sinobacterium norvegicum TaxID=1641715 RepID=A0ABM9AFP3_9GAMM|nr:hypothetical protein SIN8267_02138 [Sinobacterium norvegicum]
MHNTKTHVSQEVRYSQTLGAYDKVSSKSNRAQQCRFTYSAAQSVVPKHLKVRVS